VNKKVKKGDTRVVSDNYPNHAGLKLVCTGFVAPTKQRKSEYVEWETERSMGNPEDWCTGFEIWYSKGLDDPVICSASFYPPFPE
jgi:hypothetical protein